MFGMGCFWGVERMFWKLPGVWVTAAGYAGGTTPNPTYQEVCTGQTGHNEVVLVVYDPAQTSYETLLRTFWEGHDPTQGMRQGNDVGTQYRSGIYAFDAGAARRGGGVDARLMQKRLKPGGLRAGHDRDRATRRPSTTPRTTTSSTWRRTPAAIAGIGGTGVSCPIGVRSLTAA